MSEAATLFSILAGISVGMVSPGPSFVLVCQTAAAQSRAAGLLAALGMGAGAGLLGLLAALGAGALIASSPIASAGLKLFGATYLLWIAFSLWRAGGAEPKAGAVAHRPFLTAFLTQISNPKALFFYASVIAAFVREAAPLSFALALCACAFVMEASWYAATALVFSAPRARTAFLARALWINRACALGVAFMALRLARELV